MAVATHSCRYLQWPESHLPRLPTPSSYSNEQLIGCSINLVNARNRNLWSATMRLCWSNAFGALVFSLMSQAVSAGLVQLQQGTATYSQTCCNDNAGPFSPA